MSRALLGTFAAVLVLAACSGACSKSSSSGGFTGDGGGSSGTSGSSGASSSGASSGTSGVPTDGAAPLSRGAVDARLTGANCTDRLALKLGVVAAGTYVANGDANGGDTISVSCTVTPTTGVYSVSFGVVSGVSFGVRGTTDKPSAVLANEITQFAGDACTVVTSDVGVDKVLGSFKCTTTTVNSSSSGGPQPTPCELDADFAVYGCATR